MIPNMLSPTGTKWIKMTHSSQDANIEGQMSNLKTEREGHWRKTGKEDSKVLIQFLAHSLSNVSLPIPYLFPPGLGR